MCQYINFSNQFSLICKVSRWFSFLIINEVSQYRGVTAHAWWLCQCETGACQYHWCSIYRGLERVGSWVPGGSVGRDQLAMAAKVRRHWFNPCRLGSRGHLGANFSLLLYTDLIKKRKPSRYINFSVKTSYFFSLKLKTYLHHYFSHFCTTAKPSSYLQLSLTSSRTHMKPHSTRVIIATHAGAGKCQ